MYIQEDWHFHRLKYSQYIISNYKGNNNYYELLLNSKYEFLGDFLFRNWCLFFQTKNILIEILADFLLLYFKSTKIKESLYSNQRYWNHRYISKVHPNTKYFWDVKRNSTQPICEVKFGSFIFHFYMKDQLYFVIEILDKLDCHHQIYLYLNTFETRLCLR